MLLKWLWVIVATILTPIISVFLLHLILYQTLTVFIDPYPEMPERLLTPLVVTASMIYGTYKTAPKYKVGISLITALLILLFQFSMLIILWSGGTYFGRHLELKYGGWEMFMGFLGVIIGLLTNLKLWMNALANEPDKPDVVTGN